MKGDGAMGMSGDATMAARAPTDGERVISLVEEVRQLRNEVATMRHEQAVNDRYLTLIERFLSLSEGRHANQYSAESPPVRDREHDLGLVMEIAKALDVSERLDVPERPGGEDSEP